MMFTYASRMGAMIGVTEKWQLGMTSRPPNIIDKFPTRIAGWIYDGKSMHKNVVFTPAIAELNSKNKTISAWNSIGKKKVGSYLSASNQYEIGIDAKFVGDDIDANFTIYAEDYENEIEIPQIVEVKGPNKGKFGNIRSVAWRRFKFKGKFVHDGTTTIDEGIGYFQRVLMNVPLHPWMWNYTVFADGSVFSSFMFYSSLNYFKRSFDPLPSFLARQRYHIAPSAYFYEVSTNTTYYFDTAKIIPLFDENKLVVGFQIWAETYNRQIAIRIDMIVKASAGYNMKHRLFRNYYSVYSWTEFMIETTKIAGMINDRRLNSKVLGRGFGNTEYSMGISI